MFLHTMQQAHGNSRWRLSFSSYFSFSSPRLCGRHSCFAEKNRHLYLRQFCIFDQRFLIPVLQLADFCMTSLSCFLLYLFIENNFLVDNVRSTLQQLSLSVIFSYFNVPIQVEFFFLVCVVATVTQSTLITFFLTIISTTPLDTVHYCENTQWLCLRESKHVFMVTFRCTVSFCNSFVNPGNFF